MMEGDTAGGDNVFSLLYPLNKSLAEEIERLFSKWSFSLESPCYGTAEGKHIHDDKIMHCISLKAVRHISKRSTEGSCCQRN
jgi:hypothetical protein